MHFMTLMLKFTRKSSKSSFDQENRVEVGNSWTWDVKKNISRNSLFELEEKKKRERWKTTLYFVSKKIFASSALKLFRDIRAVCYSQKRMHEISNEITF